MNPLELVTKTLYSFEEKDLTKEVLLAFGKRAKTFEQYNDVAKIFFEIKYPEITKKISTPIKPLGTRLGKK